MEPAADFYLSAAEPSDCEAILATCPGLHGGLDYLDHTLPHWLADERERGADSPWRCFVLREAPAGRVVGFQAYHAFEGGRSAIHLALRVDPGIRRKSVGMRFITMGEREMAKVNPKVSAVV